MSNLYSNAFAYLCVGDNHHESMLDTCEAVALVTHLIYLDDSVLTDAHRWALRVDIVVRIAACRVSVDHIGLEEVSVWT